jgi:2-C-methyl-D-erythritol 4-phosphate cytidylyltransferase
MVIVYNPEFKDLLSVTGASESQIHFVAGGKERSDSVFNGLSYVAETFKNCRNVLIHDAARPFVSGEVVQSLINELSNYHAAIPVIDLKDSLREKKANSTVAVDRSSYCLVQTPQAFRLNSLMSAFQRTEIRVYTDEASLMESQGYEIKTTKGDDLLFKITSPLDYTLAIAISNEV